MPQKLDRLLDTFDMFPDPADRTGMLLSYSDQFKEVPPEIATRPFPKDHQVPQCESDAYVWAMRQPGGRTQRCEFSLRQLAPATAQQASPRCNGRPPRCR